MKDNLKCFKAYDIRARLGEDLNEDIAYRIGRACATFLQARSLVVGGDIRLSSESLKNALARGIMDAGTDVIDLGMTGTEEIYFATSHLGVDGGIEVTASHNPIDYNGMKLVREESKPISGNTGLNTIKEMAENNNFPDVEAKGQLIKKSIVIDFTEHLLSYVDTLNLKKMKILVNAGNGAAGHVIDEIERKFLSLSVPVEFIKINHEPDGTFPNGIPNPLLPENRAETSRAVIEHSADLGIAWDGDFDRCFLFDEKGGFIEGYYIVGLLAAAFLKKNPGAKIIHDPRLTWNTVDIVKESGGIAIESQTGHAFIKERMRLEDAVYGGEMSAHHYFRDFAYCDSGMIPWLLIIELMCLRNMKLSEFVEQRMAAYPASGEINFTIENPKAAIEKILKTYETEALKIEWIDGLSMSFEKWRLNIRSSNTEPLLRLNVESRGCIDLMKEKTLEISKILERC